MIDTWTADDAATDWKMPQRVALWSAINDYAVACGGNPATRTISGRRMDAVVRVERAVQAMTLDAGPDGNRVLPVRVRGPRRPAARGWLWWVLLVVAVASSVVYLVAIN